MNNNMQPNKDDYKDIQTAAKVIKKYVIPGVVGLASVGVVVAKKGAKGLAQIPKIAGKIILK